MSFDPPDIDPASYRRAGGLPIWLEWATSIAALVV
jgi:hypothetical protein